jgi:adenine-specific DNA-methyltransferase
MVYADPPYNQRQYSANYAPLKLLSEYQAGAVRAETKSGLAIEAYKSTFCRRTDVASAFEGLVTSARACADYLVVSYSSDGLLNRTDLDEILGDRATCQIIEHKRYRAARGQAPAGSPTKVSELLYVVPLYSERYSLQCTGGVTRRVGYPQVRALPSTPSGCAKARTGRAESGSCT